MLVAAFIMHCNDALASFIYLIYLSISINDAARTTALYMIMRQNTSVTTSYVTTTYKASQHKREFLQQPASSPHSSSSLWWWWPGWPTRQWRLFADFKLSVIFSFRHHVECPGDSHWSSSPSALSWPSVTVLLILPSWWANSLIPQ